ncbi:hypothetical protein lpbnt_00892 [Legionella pneumophila]|nr:hypothetical protein lpbnt_00892 [Legionella pneumophila]GAN19900.1 hypothetical protein lpofk_00893 [Legionella pneumophila]
MNNLSHTQHLTIALLMMDLLPPRTGIKATILLLFIIIKSFVIFLLVEL